VKLPESKSLFASFSSEKDESHVLFTGNRRPRPAIARDDEIAQRVAGAKVQRGGHHVAAGIGAGNAEHVIGEAVAGVVEVEQVQFVLAAEAGGVEQVGDGACGVTAPLLMS
jgi:hypothetical protein